MTSLEVMTTDEVGAAQDTRVMSLSPASSMGSVTPMDKAFRLYKKSLKEADESTARDLEAPGEKEEVVAHLDATQTAEVSPPTEDDETRDEANGPSGNEKEEERNTEDGASNEEHSEQAADVELLKKKLLVRFPLKLSRSFQRTPRSMDKYTIGRSRSIGNQPFEKDTDITQDKEGELKSKGSGIPLLRRLSFRSRKEIKTQPVASETEEHKTMTPGKPPLRASTSTKPPLPPAKPVQGRNISASVHEDEKTENDSATHIPVIPRNESVLSVQSIQYSESLISTRSIPYSESLISTRSMESRCRSPEKAGIVTEMVARSKAGKLDRTPLFQMTEDSKTTFESTKPDPVLEIKSSNIEPQLEEHATTTHEDVLEDCSKGMETTTTTLEQNPSESAIEQTVVLESPTSQGATIPVKEELYEATKTPVTETATEHPQASANKEPTTKSEVENTLHESASETVGQITEKDTSGESASPEETTKEQKFEAKDDVTQELTDPLNDGGSKQEVDTKQDELVVVANASEVGVSLFQKICCGLSLPTTIMG